MADYSWTEDLKLFNKRTGFHQSVCTWIMKRGYIFPRCQFLDIGCGSGETLGSLITMSDFQFDATMIEPSKVVFGVEKILSENNINGEIFNGRVEDFLDEHPNEKFDLILSSHSIYYFKPRRDTCDKLRKRLSHKGKMLFIVRGEAGFDINLRLFLESVFTDMGTAFKPEKVDLLLEELGISFHKSQLLTEIIPTEMEIQVFFKGNFNSDNILAALVRFVGHRESYKLTANQLMDITAFIKGYFSQHGKKMIFQDYIYTIEN